MVFGQSGRGFGEEVSTDVDGHETAQAAVTAHGVQEQSGLDPGSGAEFDKGLGVGRLGDLVGVEFEDGAFGAGRVVLGQLGDVLEQGAAACVVEPLGWELFGAEGQAFGDVLTQGLVEITGGQNAVYPKHAVSPVSLEDVSEAGAAAATGTSVSGGGGSRFGRAWPRRVSRRVFGAIRAPGRRVPRRGRPLLPAHAR